MNGTQSAQGYLKQYVDSVEMKFRADDLYFAGTFPSSFDCLISIDNNVQKVQWYARLVDGKMNCTIYPGKPTVLSQNWVKFLLFN